MGITDVSISPMQLKILNWGIDKLVYSHRLFTAEYASSTLTLATNLFAQTNEASSNTGYNP